MQAVRLAGHERTSPVVLTALCQDSSCIAGIVTSLLASLLGQARIYVVLGREGLLPPSLAQLHPRRATPVRATWLTGASAGTPAAGGWIIMGLRSNLTSGLACCRCLHDLSHGTLSYTVVGCQVLSRFMRYKL